MAMVADAAGALLFEFFVARKLVALRHCDLLQGSPGAVLRGAGSVLERTACDQFRCDSAKLPGTKELTMTDPFCTMVGSLVQARACNR